MTTVQAERPDPFKTNPIRLEVLLSSCGNGKLQLPDFQRSWVWAEDRIHSLIVSVSRAFPIGALMTLASKGSGPAEFARRRIDGAAKEAAKVVPDELLLDGQQRMTSLFQACYRREVVQTITPKNKSVRRWFYFDIGKALKGDRAEALFSVPEDRRLKADFDRTIVLDLSSKELEFASLMFPVNRICDWDDGKEGFDDYWLGKSDQTKREIFKQFKTEVIQNFKSYQVPVIALDKSTSHEAVGLVFETGAPYVLRTEQRAGLDGRANILALGFHRHTGRVAIHELLVLAKIHAVTGLFIVDTRFQYAPVERGLVAQVYRVTLVVRHVHPLVGKTLFGNMLVTNFYIREVILVLQSDAHELVGGVVVGRAHFIAC